MSTPSSTPTAEGPQRHGVGTYLGILTALLGAVGAIASGIAGDDAGLIAGGVAGTLGALVTAGGKFAQAVAKIRAGADTAAPAFAQASAIASAIQQALDAPSPRQARKTEDQAHRLGIASERLASLGALDHVPAREPAAPPQDLSDEDLQAVDGDVRATSASPVPADETSSFPDEDVEANP